MTRSKDTPNPLPCPDDPERMYLEPGSESDWTPFGDVAGDDWTEYVRADLAAAEREELEIEAREARESASYWKDCAEELLDQRDALRRKLAAVRGALEANDAE